MTFDQRYKKYGLHRASTGLHRMKWSIKRSRMYRTIRRLI